MDVIDLDLTDTPIAATNFGSGIGGWEADHLYVQSYGGVYELEIGVPGRPEPFLDQLRSGWNREGGGTSGGCRDLGRQPGPVVVVLATPAQRLTVRPE